MVDDRLDGGEERPSLADELLGILRALFVQIIDQFRLGNLGGRVLGHLLQDPFREIDFGFMHAMMPHSAEAEEE